ncbi:MAG: protein-export chaperone SecB [Alphaproteobacteria bacterium]|nr:protein-export chaperone SecB [Alphaproteobacteria bacterium]
MAENTNIKKFEILNQFIKDLSFEAPNSPRIFFEKIEEKPNAEVGFDIKSAPAGEHLFEVNIHLTVKNSIKEGILYFIELSYSSMVALNAENNNEENTNILLKQVPAYLFPFARSIVADLTRESGFPPFVLAPVDFSKVEVKQAVNTQNTAPANKE